MAVLNESGVPDVLPPLCGLDSLAERLPRTLIALVGTRTEAFLARFVPDALSQRTPSSRGADASRVITIVLEPDKVPEQGLLAGRLIEAGSRFKDIETVLLVAGSSTSLLGVNAAFEARVAARRLGVPVRVVTPDPSISTALHTDIEDRSLAALLELCPRPQDSYGNSRAPDPTDALPSKQRGRLGGLLGRNRGAATSQSRTGRPRRRSVVLLGAAGSGTRSELSAALANAGVEVAGSVPVAEAGKLPVLDEETVIAVADPYLSSAARAAAERGGRVVETLMPIGVDGTAQFIQDVSAEAGQEASELLRMLSTWEDLGPLRNRIRGKRIFFAGDTSLEIPIARFLVDAGAVVLEVGAPRLERELLNAEIRALSAHVDVVESPDPTGQMGRIAATRPDVVVASPGLYAPLVARGQLCRSSLDFLGAGIHGYEGARRILEIFIRSFERAETLDSVRL